MLSKTLYVRYGSSSWQVKLVAEKDYVSTFPGVVSNTSAPVDYAEVTAFDFPSILCSEACFVLETFVIIGPAWNTLLAAT